jgi:hypothetical protein
MCATSRGKAGNVARSSGDMMSVGERQEDRQKHHLVNKPPEESLKDDWVSPQLQPKARPETC